MEIYRLIVEKFPIENQNPRALAFELGIQDEAEIEAFVNLYSSIHLFYPGIGQEDSVSPHHKLGCGYSVKDLNGDGVDELVLMNKDYYIMAIFSYSNEKPVLLGNYWERNSCWIDGDGLLHNNGSSGADRSTSAIYKIADGGESLELISEFGTNGHEWVDDVAYTKYYKVVGSEKVSIIESEYNALVEQYGKYLGSVASAETTKEYSGLTFTSLYTEAEIAMEMYEAVLDNKVKIYNSNYTNNDKYIYLKDFKSYDVSLSLCETTDLSYSYIDINGDSVKELFIHHGEISIFWYHQGIVYGYSPGIANDDLNHDGSFDWRTYSENFGYGESKFVLNGSKIQTEVCWRIVNDGEPNVEYYIGDKQVTQEEILKYFEDTPKTKAEFSPLEASWLNKISHYEAITIAKNYWKDFDIEENGYLVKHVINSWAPDTAYVIVIQRHVIDHYSTFDEIWVDKNTGETIIPYTPDGKGGNDELTKSYPLTEEQAWSLANTYWDCQDGSKDYGAGTIWSAKIVVSDTPSSDDKYYKVDFLIEWISNGGSDGDDGTTPYAVHAMDRILINAFTGEITTPACEAGNKCISVEEAIEIAEKHCKDADLDNGKNVYRGKLDANVSAPDHIYVIVIQKFVDNYYAYDTRYWIDKYTGEIVTPYYMYGKG